MIPENFPPTGWTVEVALDVGDADNYWKGKDLTVAASPQFPAYEGDVCAFYDCGINSPNGGQSRMYTPAISLVGSTVVDAVFYVLMRSYGGSGQCGNIIVQASTDGTTWTTLDTINLYDAGAPSARPSSPPSALRPDWKGVRPAGGPPGP